MHAVIADQVDLSEPGYVLFKTYDPSYPDVLRPTRYNLASGEFTYVIDEQLGPQPVVGFRPEPNKPTQMNTVLHAGAWEFTYTITDYYFPPPLMDPPLMQWASPCTLDILPEVSETAVEVRMPPPQVPINDFWMRGNVLGETLALNGVVEFWYVYVDPSDGSIKAGFGEGSLDYFVATFEDDLACEGNFKASGQAPELGIEIWYSGTFTGRRPEPIPAKAMSAQGCPSHRPPPG